VKAETALEIQVKKIVMESDSNDDKIYKIEEWVRDNIRYASDKIQFNMAERWTNPMETLQRKKGDCEDGAMLVMAMAVAAGIPRDRLRVYAPIVTSGGMHACTAYKRETDDAWVWMEWTYDREDDYGDVDKRPAIKEVSIIPLGTYLELTSLNPFKTTLLTDKEMKERADRILGKDYKPDDSSGRE